MCDIMLEIGLIHYI